MATIQIWNRCNNKCIMCTNPLWFSKEPGSVYSFERIVSRIRKLSTPDLKDGFHISGGEPTIHPDFFNVMRFIGTKFPSRKIYLLSNGRMFAYEDFTERVLAFDGIALQIPVLGHTASLHDSITGVRGSFEQTVSGIRNILRRKSGGQQLELRIVLVKQNYRYLDAIVGFIHTNFGIVDTLVIIFPELEGRCGANFKHTGITYSLTGRYVLDAVRKWSAIYRDLRLYHFPLCAIAYPAWPFIWVTHYPGETAHIKECRECRLKRYCSGIHKDYLHIVGAREFSARTKNIPIDLNKRIQNKYHPITELS